MPLRAPLKHSVMLGLVTLLTAGCGTTTGGRTELLVSAAASLTGAFTEIADAFEGESTSLDVVLNFGGSSALRQQILEGAPVDVFASANMSNMDRVVAVGGASGPPETFARNALQIVVPAGNPGGIGGLEDFAREEPLLGLCAEEVPCGDFAREALENAGVKPVIDTNEPDVRALLTKVDAGELDGAIIYVTDLAVTQRAIEGVDIPDELNVVTEYPIAVLAEAPNPDPARGFVSFVLSSRGQEILARHGFAAP